MFIEQAVRQFEIFTDDSAPRAVMERVSLTYMRTFPTSTTDPVDGIEEGEVEYEMTREQWERRAT